MSTVRLWGVLDTTARLKIPKSSAIIAGEYLPGGKGEERYGLILEFCQPQVMQWDVAKRNPMSGARVLGASVLVLSWAMVTPYGVGYIGVEHSR